MSFDVWGKRRDPSTWSDSALYAYAFEGGVGFSVTPQYTGHVGLGHLELVHMQGRVYDPVLGWFLSADPYVQDPASTQSFNRYSYVWNNPLSYTDPSGYFSLKSLGHAVLWSLGIPPRLWSKFTGWVRRLAKKQWVGQVIGAVGWVVGVLTGNPWLGGMISFVASGLQAAINGASVPEILYAAGQGYSRASYGAGAAGSQDTMWNQDDIPDGWAGPRDRSAGRGGYADTRWDGRIRFGASAPDDAPPGNALRGAWNWARNAISALGSGLAYLAKVQAVDTFALVYANTVGKAQTLYYDLRDLRNSLTARDYAGAALQTLAIPAHIAFPYYGFYGGWGYGTRAQPDASAAPAPFNKQDWANLRHDRGGNHAQWITDSVSERAPGLHTGIFGWSYAVVGAAPFSVGGALQEVGVLSR